MSDSQFLDPQPEALKKINHIVVLMLENRSFDNLLGWLYDDETPPREQKFEGLNWDLWNPLSNFDSDGNPFTEKVGVRKNGHDFFIGSKKNRMMNQTLRCPVPIPVKATETQLINSFTPISWMKFSLPAHWPWVLLIITKTLC